MGCTASDRYFGTVTVETELHSAFPKLGNSKSVKKVCDLKILVANLVWPGPSRSVGKHFVENAGNV